MHNHPTYPVSITLEAAGKPSRKETETRPAREIESEEIVELTTRPIYERGARSMADHVRGYIHAAYSWE